MEGIKNWGGGKKAAKMTSKMETHEENEQRKTNSDPNDSRGQN